MCFWRQGEEGAMRFEVTTVLDAIERHLTTEAALAQVAVDIGEVAWFEALDGGRPVNLLRTGLLVDALARHFGEDAIRLYPVAGRDLLTDADLTSKERMVLGRWSSDGLIEVVPNAVERVLEVADITGLALASCRDRPGAEQRYPWLRSERLLRLVPGEGGAAIHGGHPGPAQASGPGAGLMAHVWRCPRRDCSIFGDRRAVTPAVPHMRAGVPSCPRHGEPLVNGGPKPPSVTLALTVDGVVRERFVLHTGRPVMVGRAPDHPSGIVIGHFMSGSDLAMISRNHLQFELRDEVVLVTDVSTNGTVVRSRNSAYAQPEEIHLAGGPAYPLKPWDTVEPHDRVALGRADRMITGTGRSSGSVMGDAPTISLGPPM
jgi:hypothetical protein